MVKCEITRKGYPALWEEGGGKTNTGWARVIAGPAGERLRAIALRRWANGPHALFIIQEGCLMIEASFWNKEGYTVKVYRVASLERHEDGIYAVLECVDHVFPHQVGEYMEELESTGGELLAAVKAAMEKACCYHCREAHYYTQ